MKLPDFTKNRFVIRAP